MTKQINPNRLARYVFRLGVAVCVLIVVFSVASFWWSVNVSVAGRTVRLDYAAVYVVFDRIAPGAGWSAWSTGAATQDFHLWTATWRITGVIVRAFPTWMFLLAALIPTVLAWRRLRRPLPGHCQKCGYDLTGNVTGKCSECGSRLGSDDPPTHQQYDR